MAWEITIRARAWALGPLCLSLVDKPVPRDSGTTKQAEGNTIPQAERLASTGNLPMPKDFQIFHFLVSHVPIWGPQVSQCKLAKAMKL